MADERAGMVPLDGTDQEPEDVARSGTSSSGPADLTIVENPAAGIYEGVVGDVTAAGVVYTKVGNRVTLLATSVFPEFRGQGYATRLLAGVLDRLREDGATATVSCPFAATFLSDHPEYADVLDSRVPARALAEVVTSVKNLDMDTVRAEAAAREGLLDDGASG